VNGWPTRLFDGEHGALCERDGITAIVPRAETVNPNGTEYFSRDRFSYDRESDSWRCPAGTNAEPVQDFPYPEEERVHEPGVRHLCAEAAMHQGGAAGDRADFYEDAREAMHQRPIADPIG